jgi:argininosuccinate lyase
MVNQKSPNQKKANQMWGGQFESAPADIMARINASIEFDSKLYAQDIKGSIAHATMLAETEILTKKEANEIIKGLKAIQIEIESGNFVFKQELEDIHMNIELK